MIKVKVIAHSVWNGAEIISWQLTYPRFILPQLNTHRRFSKSTASSRAIPVAAQIDRVRENCVFPHEWGVNKAGMSASEVLSLNAQNEANKEWAIAALNACNTAEHLNELGVHKQVVNRILEPFMEAHTIVTTTEWDNFFKLRIHDAAQPEIQQLAIAMKKAKDESTPKHRKYHLPYVSNSEITTFMNSRGLTDKDETFIYKFFATISAARCARVSYLNHDQTVPDLTKDKTTAFRLLEHEHMSPFEHQAKSANEGYTITHPDGTIEEVPANKRPYKNFEGWIQFRHTYEEALMLGDKEAFLAELGLCADCPPKTDALAERPTDTLASIQEWFNRAVPNPNDTNQCVQIGCHIEEFLEMVSAFLASHNMIQNMGEIASFATNLKSGKFSCNVLSEEEQVELFDAMLDQIVTAVGVCHMFGWDLAGGLKEVDDSNWSKFENGKPVFIPGTLKIGKGKNFVRVNLRQFIKRK